VTIERTRGKVLGAPHPVGRVLARETLEQRSQRHPLQHPRHNLPFHLTLHNNNVKATRAIQSGPKTLVEVAKFAISDGESSDDIVFHKYLLSIIV
jgi:hypothetical protein